MSGPVRPFRGRIVKAEAAAGNLTPMTDALVAGVPGSERVPEVREDDYGEASTGLCLYRLQREGEEHVGVVADVSVAAFADGRVRGHEAVCATRVDGLVAHFASVPQRTELVALLHEAGAEQQIIADTMRADPELDFTGPDGWRQSVWRVPEESADELAQVLARPVHYIADGHHRVAASLALWESAGRPPQAALLCVLHPLDGLRLRAFHRRVVGPVDPTRLQELLRSCCAVSEHATQESLPPGAIGVYVAGAWWGAVPSAARAAGVDGLDVTLLQEQVLTPLLGAEADERTETASIAVPVAELVERCDRDGGALFVLPPPSLEQLREVADLGQVMPPKTTYFDPKPYAGLIVR